MPSNHRGCPSADARTTRWSPRQSRRPLLVDPSAHHSTPSVARSGSERVGSATRPQTQDAPLARTLRHRTKLRSSSGPSLNVSNQLWKCRGSGRAGIQLVVSRTGGLRDHHGRRAESECRASDRRHSAALVPHDLKRPFAPVAYVELGPRGDHRQFHQ